MLVSRCFGDPWAAILGHWLTHRLVKQLHLVDNHFHRRSCFAFVEPSNSATDCARRFFFFQAHLSKCSILGFSLTKTEHSGPCVPWNERGKSLYDMMLRFHRHWASILLVCYSSWMTQTIRERNSKTWTTAIRRHRTQEDPPNSRGPLWCHEYLHV